MWKLNTQRKAYVTVIAYIKQLVQDGQLAFGGKLPSEREMMATLGLGRNSIREALRTLENMGLISCVHGKGNFLVNQIGESFSSVFSMLLFLKQSNFDEVQQLRRGLEMQPYSWLSKRQIAPQPQPRPNGVRHWNP